jgi:hypothetical protein
MLRNLFLLLIAVISLPACKGKITIVGQPEDTVKQFSVFNIEFKLKLPFNDPYDESDIAVNMNIAAPNGDTIILPCFYQSGIPDDSKWGAKFTPRDTGKYNFFIRAESKHGIASSDRSGFFSSTSEGNGFLHLNSGNNYYLTFDSGKPFRGLGENFGWESRNFDDPGLTYDTIFEKFHRNGMNVTRTWMCPWNLPLEWKKPDLKIPYHHFYSNDSATFNHSAIDRLNFMISQAEKNDIYVILVLDYHGALRTKSDYWGGNRYWLESNYNIDNGGPANSPLDFFVNPQSKNQYKNRLRYLVARWGYSSHILAWEFWNEIDNLKAGENMPANEIVNWHQEMADYLKSIDPYHHLVTTSLSHRNMDSLFRIKNIDFTETHLYGRTGKIHQIADSMTTRFNKPYVAGEFSLDWKDVTPSRRPDFLEDLHEGLWRGLFSETPIIPLTWWWETYDLVDAYPLFKCVNDFSRIMTSMNTVRFGILQLVLPPGIDGSGLMEGNQAYGWIINKNKTKLKPAVDIRGLKDGIYSLKYYDTYRGSFGDTINIMVSKGACKIVLPGLDPGSDIAFILSRVN